MSESNCSNCMSYRRGECAGIKVCSDYKPAPSYSNSGMDYWPKEMRYRQPKIRSNVKREWRERSSYTPERIPRNFSRESVKIKKTEVLNQCSAISIQKRFYGDVLLWVSYENAGKDKYKGIALLQYTEHYLNVESLVKTTGARDAIISVLYEAVGHITKPCKVYTICETDLWDFSYNPYQKDRNNLWNIVKSFDELQCEITEVIAHEQNEMIRRHIKNPVVFK